MHPHTFLDLALPDLCLAAVSQSLVELPGHCLEAILVVLELDVELSWILHMTHPHTHCGERSNNMSLHGFSHKKNTRFIFSRCITNDTHAEYQHF